MARPRPARPQRGLFTRGAGVWSDDRGRRRYLAAYSLLWMDGAAGSAWDFLPGATEEVEPDDALDWGGSGDGPPGWWLGFGPGMGMAQQ